MGVGISFLKKLLGGNGHQVDAVQGVVDIHASSEGGAINRARPVFARRAGVQAWSLRADHAVAEVLPRQKYVSDSRPERSQTAH
jgi:1,2-phenylacetyl-CoA epoxidase PaaB subunit